MADFYSAFDPLFPKPPLEAFDIGILDRLTRINEGNLYPMIMGPAFQRPPVCSGPLSTTSIFGNLPIMLVDHEHAGSQTRPTPMLP